VATGRYTKLFRYLDKSPKRYRATLWLGAKSDSLDLENILSIKDIKRLKDGEVDRVFNSLRGDITYTHKNSLAKKDSLGEEEPLLKLWLRGREKKRV